VRNRFATAQPWLSTLARVFLAGVFVLAGWPKLTDPEGTVRSVRAFQLLPEALVRPFAYGMPLVELCLALILLVGIATRLGAVLTALMMIMYLFGISMAWGRGLKIDCGCFGSSGGTVVDPVPGYVKDLLRDSGFLLVALFLARWPFSRLSADAPLGITRPSEPDDRVLATR
jgi:uncharacterized membrane protein YphA (DoxX/SURF4 family)